MEKEDKKIFVRVALRENPDIFPSPQEISSELSKKYCVKISVHIVKEAVNVKKAKNKWLRDSPDDRRFLECLNLHGKFSFLDERGRKTVRKRLRKICKAICAEEGFFPACNRIAEKINEKYRVNISERTILRNLELEQMQIKWVKNTDAGNLPDAIRKARFSSVREEVKKAVAVRFLKIIAPLVRQNGMFPSRTAISKMIWNEYSIKLTRCTLGSRLNIEKLQLDWLKGCSDDVFLSNLKEQRMRGVEERVKKKITERKNAIEEQKAMGVDHADFVKKAKPRGKSLVLLTPLRNSHRINR